jgi:Uma2 family endonuclease
MLNPRTALPRLENGDRLTREEFHRRYCERPDIKKAELIEGVVYLPSPARFGVHGEPHGFMATWAGHYAARTPGVRMGVEATVFLEGDNEVQPDICLIRIESGGPRLTEDNYLEGAPQAIIEVTASSASYDLGEKLDAYRRSGVREYIAWRVLNSAIDWFRLRDDRYERIEPNERRVIQSEVFPGLRLNVPKMLAGDMAGVLAELEQRPE